ncbi:DUF1178 family protein [Aureimonas frigidaquae]|uniref:Uncharacterized protein n=1 Tax=Aureimonas frigidaquae TaxID=424757 RepID=A0A0P0Z264_9HYPH|nr:DUF1178 family protein [Aureimonas frigidaquae]BAT27792.1 hypothetical protein [Aureimonas frigidaquae]
MIHYALRCRGCSHGFDGWFRSAQDYDTQSQRGLVACPSCGAGAVEKALMAPAVGRPMGSPDGDAPATKGADSVALADPRAAEVVKTFHAFVRALRSNSDYVGPRFAEEARRIHFGEAEPRGIYGEASGDEVKALLDDGVPALPLPRLPEDGN